MPKPNDKVRLHKKRAPIRGTAGVIATNANALAKPPSLPAHLTLRAKDVPFWDDILRARSIEEWGRVELVLAWQLAQIQGDILTGRQLVERGDRKELELAGFPSVRSAAATVGTLIAQQLTLMRSLMMVGTVVGDPINQVPRRIAEREAEQTINKLKGSAEENESLLAL